jgi:hypothetical protein
MEVVAAAQAATIEMGAAPSGDITVEMEYAAEDYLVSYDLVTNGGRGSDPNEPVEIERITGASLMKKPVATKTRPRPWAYILPRVAVDAVAMLRRHGILVERLTQPTELQVDAYTVAGVTHEQAYNHAATTIVEVGEVVTQDRTFPVGTYIVPTAQYLGRLVTHMLEVETEDNVVYWNTMDAWIPRTPQAGGRGGGRGGFGRGRGQAGPPVVPIFKLMAPTALPTRVMGS